MNTAEFLKYNARKLRKNMTPTEVSLWQRITKNIHSVMDKIVDEL